MSKIIEVKKYEYYGKDEFQKVFPIIATETSVNFHTKQRTQCIVNNEDKKRKANIKKEPLRKYSEELRQQHPDFSKSDIARLVQKKYPDYAIRTITDLVPDKIK